MTRHRWYSFAAAAVIALAVAAPAAGQPQGLEARVRALADEVAELRELAVQAPPVAAAVEALSSAVAELEHEVGALRRQQRAIPEAVETIDELEARVRDLERELGLLRAQVSDLEQPVIGRGGAVARDRGFSWTTEDGAHALALWGRFQPRYQLEIAEGFDEAESQSFLIRRARLGVHGHIGGPALRYAVKFELRGEPLLDGFIDYVVRDELVLRAGQSKVPFSRAYLTSGGNLGFAERPRTVDALRYDREMSVSAYGELLGDRLGYQAGVGNGTGRNRPNDSLDLLPFLRLDAVVFGERFGYRIADLSAEQRASLMVGASLVHDTPRIPDVVGGVLVPNTDVDADGERDAIRVISASADAAFAHGGLELTLEGLWRREDWGAILDHPENAGLAQWVGSGVEHYFGAYGQATYALVPGLLIVGARAGGVEQPLFGIGGREPAWPRDAGAPPSVGMLWEGSAMGQLYRDGRPFLGLDYSYFHHELSGAGPGHRLIIQAQVDI
jgi:hypothetical protein